MFGSVALALALGLRHGLDADHLAAIDGMTRFQMVQRRAFAPYCGALFSTGHGAVIVVAAILLARLSSAWTPPGWLEPTGKIVSAAILLLLGVSNLLPALSHRQRPQHIHLVGLRSGLFARALRSSRPWQIMLVGVLFALSFDALGLAVLFASSAGLSGAAFAAVLALVFASGMIIVDTTNGLWLARLAGRSDRLSAAGARSMTISVALISLLVGAAMTSSCLSSSFDQWLNRYELGASALVVLAVFCAYLFSRQVPLPE